MKQNQRTELLLGKDALDKLNNAKIAIFGIGGVGSYAAEALARGGIGKLDLYDNDNVCVSNINRQLIALHSTIGKSKVEVMRDRITDINPNIEVCAISCFYATDNADSKDAMRLMLTDKMEELMKVQVEAIKNIKIDKVTVWDGANGDKNATAGFLSGLVKSIPPMNELFDMAGMQLPNFLGKEKGEETADVKEVNGE